MTTHTLFKAIGIIFLLLILIYGTNVFAYPEGSAGSYWWGSHGFSWYRPSFWDFFHFWY